MKSGTVRVLAVLMVLLAMALPASAAGGAEEPRPSASRAAVDRGGPRRLIVFAASSLTDVLNDVAVEFESRHPGTTVVRNYGSSSTLAAQLASGEIADVFASANERQMQVVVTAGAIAGDAPVIFAGNRLVVIVPAANPGRVQGLADLGQKSLALVLAAPGVPVRDYTNAMVEKMAGEPPYGASFRERFFANMVSEENNVRQVSAKVALGEADAGVVYATDVTPDIAGRIKSFDIPDRYNVVARYPAAVLRESPEPELAADFLALLSSPTGRGLLTRWGFTLP